MHPQIRPCPWIFKIFKSMHFFLAHKMYTYNDMTRSHQLKCYNIQSYTNSLTTFFHKGMHYKGTRWNNIRIMQQIMLNICFFSFLSLTLMHGTFLMHDKHSLCDTLEFVILSKIHTYNWFSIINLTIPSPTKNNRPHAHITFKIQNMTSGIWTNFSMHFKAQNHDSVIWTSKNTCK